MKYFAKYLPVEGEIKEGDTILLNDGSITKDIALRNLFKGVKVKLYLCSRDNPENIEGRIETHWVKEGQEFSEDEIHRCFVPGKGDPMIRKVQIKCPCCDTFM